MSKTELVLKWTAKTPLSSRIQDPLGMYVLKFLERYFLPGITTQTQRLRYYSFLTWAWKTILDKNLKYQRILNMEKVLTLAAAYHHLNDGTPPNGMRNRRSAKDFISSHSSYRINQFVNFGRNNRNGYGNYYYKGPLATLQICARIGDEITISEVGEKIADSFANSIGANIDLFLRDKLLKRDLQKLEPTCLCGDKVSLAERRLWRKVFFGFAKPSGNFSLQLDSEEFSHFKQGKIVFYEVTIEGTLDIQDYLRDMEAPEVFLSDTLQESIKKIMARRAPLFLIMRILQKAKPTTEPGSLNQTIRDCLYFNQFEEDGAVNKITFGPLIQYCKLWESYIHNLYYINFFEFMFGILLEKLKVHPMGIDVKGIIGILNVQQILEGLQSFSLDAKDEEENIDNLEQSLRKRLNGKPTTLKAKLNEKVAFLNSLSAEETEDEIANLIVLFLLLRYRFENFSQSQKTACEFKEGTVYSVRPTMVYRSFSNMTLTDFLKSIFDLVRNRHRLISTLKYALNGTRSWLFTEEEGFNFYYGTDYWVRSYREAKWNNVTELLIDMGLVKVSNSKYCLSEVGEKWLGRIF